MQRSARSWSSFPPRLRVALSRAPNIEHEPRVKFGAIDNRANDVAAPPFSSVNTTPAILFLPGGAEPDDAITIDYKMSTDAQGDEDGEAKLENGKIIIVNMDNTDAKMKFLCVPTGWGNS